MNSKLFLLPLILLTNLNNVALKESETTSIFDDLSSTEIVQYYSDLSDKKGMKGDELRYELQTIISSNHKQIPRSEAWSTTWKYFLLLDRNYEVDPLTDIEKSTGEWKTTNVTCSPLYLTKDITFTTKVHDMDREHIWPKSRGFKYKNNASEEDGKEQPYAATDMHNLRMGEKQNNENGHNNYPYGNVVDKEATTTKKIVDQVYSETTGYLGLNEDGLTVYEPLDKDKGDIARSLFYMATRYYTFKGVDSFEPSLDLVSTFSNMSEARDTITVKQTQTTSATYGILKDLLKWNELDPVSDFEIHRNNLCYNIVQGNRNPFVDYPSWANVCFGNSEKGVDLSSSNGVESTGLSIQNNIFNNSYELNDSIDLSTLKFTFTKDDNSTIEINYEDPSLVINVYLNNNEINVENDTILFSNEGEYEIKITYTFEEKQYDLSYKIIIKDNSIGTAIKRNWLYILGGIILAIIFIILVIILNLNKHKKKGKRKRKH